METKDRPLNLKSWSALDEEAKEMNIISKQYKSDTGKEQRNRKK